MKSQKNKIAAILLFCVMIAAVGRASQVAYVNFRDTVVEQQQQHLLTIAKSISNNMRLYMEGKSTSLKILASTPRVVSFMADPASAHYREDIGEILRSVREEQKLKEILLIDTDRNIRLEQKEGREASVVLQSLQVQHDIERVLESGEAVVGRVYRNQDGEFLVDLLQPVLEEGRLVGAFIAVISAGDMYEEIVRPVRAGEQGYAMVKDQEGTIIMHPVEEQVGYDVIDTRREVYPELDYIALEQLIERQLGGEEGTAVYESYWWTAEELEKITKLSAFTPFRLAEDNFWVVAVVMSYSEIQLPIMKYLAVVILMALLLVAVLSWTMYMAVRMKKNQEDKEAYALEMQYLKKINESSEELRRKDKELQHSNKLRTIGTLTSGISHEFNNLLTPIMGHSEIILHHMDKTSPFYEGIRDIHDSSVKAKELISQILVFSHNENAPVEEKSFNLNALARETIRFFKPILPSSISVVEDIEEGEALMTGNDTEIRQVLMNLFTNAFYAMKENGGTLTVEVRKEAQETDGQKAGEPGHARILVADTGCGMDEDTLSQMFDPFFTSKPVGEGTGLGLSMVHGIVEKYEGRIHVASEPGKGTSFEILLPLGGTERVQEEAEGQDGCLGSESVLLVDDNRLITKVLGKGLAHWGYKVKSFNESVEAFQHFHGNREQYDILVLDQSMPHLTGLNFARKARQIQPDIRIILITSYKDKTVDRAVKDRTVDRILIKPFLTKELGRCIRQLMDAT
ncbi:sensor histidine kinase [Anaerotalea alkaliphila]|uniref:Stage 0 sporulation protein A homolog n=1 Tax=Anaerotalea alkaliphila TaxID=2662126 RepID=A0A7X5HUD8_9FIRM|nr:sensor histidine kinase [Anaerotalea alkaliphila]NDL66833.1 response regulator [Anaerotalea alkaliphila]